MKIDIVGYTDSTGSDDINQRIGLERAQSLETALVGCGVANELLISYSAFNHPSYDGLAERIVRLIVNIDTLD